MELIFESFPAGPLKWRVAWIDEVYDDRRHPSEPSVNVFLLSVDTEKSLSAVASIGVGQLPYVDIGSVWQDQRRLEDYYKRKGDKTLLATVTFDVTTDSEGVCGLAENPLGSLDLSWLGAHKERLKPCNVTVIDCTRTATGRNNIKTYLFPALLLVKTFYTPTSSLARVVFRHNGIREGCNNLLSTWSETGEGNERHIDLALKGDLKNQDAYFVAWWRLSRRAFAGATGVQRSLTANRINGTFPTPRATFPIEGRLKLKAQVRRVEDAEGNSHRLVEQILSASITFPFASITSLRPQKPLWKKGAGEAQSATQFEVEPRPKPDSGKKKVKHIEPSSQRKEVDIFDKGLFPDLLDKPITVLHSGPKTIAVYAPLPAASGENPAPESEDLSTSAGVTGKKEAVKGNIDSTGAPEPDNALEVDESEADKLASIDHLGDLDGIRKRLNVVAGIPSRYRVVAEGSSRENYSLFPPLDDIAYMNREEGQLRAVCIVQFDVEGRYFYLFECERKWYEQDRFRLGLGWSHRGAPDDEEVEAMLTDVLSHWVKAQGSWPTEKTSVEHYNPRAQNLNHRRHESDKTAKGPPPTDAELKLVARQRQELLAAKIFEFMRSETGLKSTWRKLASKKTKYQKNL